MDVAALQSWLERFVDADGPGAAVAVELKGERVFEAQRGLANLEWSTPIDGETVFRIASVTKQFTAAAIIRLAEDGKLGLDDPIGRRLVDYGPAGEAISIRQLLAHTSGVGDYTTDRVFMTEQVGRDHTVAELVAIIRDLPREFEPGSHCSYNNSGYVLAGAIIEAVSGRPYGNYLSESFFRPLGLVHTRYLHDVEIVPKRASGYSPGRPPTHADWLAGSNPHGAGGLGSTPGDLLTWSRALREGRVVSRAGYEAMATPGPLTDYDAPTRGLGLARHELRGDVVIQHGGSINGFVAHLAHWPAHDLTVAALANSNPFPIDQLAYGLARRALGQADASYTAVPVAPDVLAASAGRFAFYNTEVLDLAAADSGLASSFPHAGSLYRPFAEDRFFLEDDPEVTFRFTDAARRSVVFQDYRSPMRGARVGAG